MMMEGKDCRGRSACEIGWLILLTPAGAILSQ
jgi:hypothetical protein